MSSAPRRRRAVGVMYSVPPGSNWSRNHSRCWANDRGRGPCRGTTGIVVASPDYLRGRARPKAPGDLHAHNCINLRFASGELHRWAFEKRGKKLEVTVDGSLTVNDGDLAVRAALDGVGICRVLSDYVTPLIAQGGTALATPLPVGAVARRSFLAFSASATL